ncbi:MAG: hypothetical protein U0361_25165 [Nitrospiraceae bacterium]
MYLEVYQLALAAAAALLGAMIFLPRRWLSRRLVTWGVAALGLPTAAWLLVVFGSTMIGGSRQKLEVMDLRQADAGRPVVIFVFGWNGDDSTWGEFPRLLMSDPAFAGYGVSSLSYRSRHGIEGLGVAETAVDVAALVNAHFASRSIMIAAHSMGGVIMRYLIATNALSNTVKIERFISVGSPFNGAEVAPLMRELGMTPATLKDLSPGSEFLSKLAQSWNEKKRDSWGGQDVCIVGRRDTIARPDSASYGCSKTALLLDLGHIDIVKPTSVGHPGYIAVTRALLGMRRAGE